MKKCKTCNEAIFEGEGFDGYCENCIPKPLCERCNNAYATYIPVKNTTYNISEDIATCDSCGKDHAYYLHCVYEDELPWR